MNKLRVADHGPPSDIVRNRRFESISLQQRVQCEPDFPRPKSDANLDFQSFTGACRAGHPTVRRCGDVRLRALVKGSWLGSSVSLWAKPHPWRRATARRFFWLTGQKQVFRRGTKGSNPSLSSREAGRRLRRPARLVPTTGDGIAGGVCERRRRGPMRSRGTASKAS